MGATTATPLDLAQGLTPGQMAALEVLGEVSDAILTNYTGIHESTIVGKMGWVHRTAAAALVDAGLARDNGMRAEITANGRKALKAVRDA